MKIFGLYITREDFGERYAEESLKAENLAELLENANKMIDFYKEEIGKSEKSNERLVSKIADLEYEISRKELDFTDMKRELDDARSIIKAKSKNQNTTDILHGIAERYRELEEKAGKYDRRLENERRRKERKRSKGAQQ